MPAQGAWWGIYPKTSTGETLLQAVARREAWAGRKFDCLRQYSDASTGGNSVLGQPDQVTLANQGYKLFVSMATRVFGGADYTWAQVTQGAIDATLHTIGQRLRTLGLPIWFGLDIEFDGAAFVNEVQADFAPMWRHVYDVIAVQEGASKVQWVWNPTGYSGNWPKLPTLWPGDGFVQAVAWDPYASSAPLKPPIDTYGFYDHLGSQTWLDTSKLYYMLAEYGCIADASRPDWLRAVPAALKAKPKLKAVMYFDSPSYLTVVLDDAASQAAFADAGHDPYLTH